MKFNKGDQVRRLSFNAKDMDVGSLWTVDNPYDTDHLGMMSVENWNELVFRNQFELVERAKPEKKLPAYVKHVPAVQEHDELVRGRIFKNVGIIPLPNKVVRIVSMNNVNTVQWDIFQANKADVLAFAKALEELAEYMED